MNAGTGPSEFGGTAGTKRPLKPAQPAARTRKPGGVTRLRHPAAPSAQPAPSAAGGNALAQAWSARRYDAFTSPPVPTPAVAGATPVSAPPTGYDAFTRNAPVGPAAGVRLMAGGPAAAPVPIASNAGIGLTHPQAIGQRSPASGYADQAAWMRTRLAQTPPPQGGYNSFAGVLNAGGSMLAPPVAMPAPNPYPAMQGWQDYSAAAPAQTALARLAASGLVGRAAW